MCAPKPIYPTDADHPDIWTYTKYQYLIKKTYKKNQLRSLYQEDKKKKLE